jgi:CheY-like chemotaxis protein
MISSAAQTVSPAVSSTILLVEDEPVLRTSMARGLAKLTNVEVLTASNYAEAVALIESNPPSLIISDIDLSGASGLELVGELQRQKKTTPIIFVTGYLKTYQPQIPNHPNVQVLEKPVPLGELRTMVSELLGPLAPATPAPFNVADYVQLACLGRHSVRIDVEVATGAAHVVIHQGDVWTAVDALGSGPEAFARLAFEPDGIINCSSLTGTPGERTISARWELLALESARAFDEAGRKRTGEFSTNPSLARLRALSPEAAPSGPLASSLVVDDVAAFAAGGSMRYAPVVRTDRSPRFLSVAPPKGPPPLPPSAKVPQRMATRASLAPVVTRSPLPPPSASFEELWKQGVDALLNREFTRAVQAFSMADGLRPNEPRIVANLQRLREMGYLDAGATTT